MLAAARCCFEFKRRRPPEPVVLRHAVSLAIAGDGETQTASRNGKVGPLGKCAGFSRLLVYVRMVGRVLTNTPQFYNLNCKMKY